MLRLRATSQATAHSPRNMPATGLVTIVSAPKVRARPGSRVVAPAGPTATASAHAPTARPAANVIRPPSGFRDPGTPSARRPASAGRTGTHQDPGHRHGEDQFREHADPSGADQAVSPGTVMLYESWSTPAYQLKLIGRRPKARVNHRARPARTGPCPSAARRRYQTQIAAAAVSAMISGRRSLGGGRTGSDGAGGSRTDALGSGLIRDPPRASDRPQCTEDRRWCPRTRA